jgi:hypothetical protein
MIESLEKKISVLDKISTLDDRQLEIAMAKPMNMKAYNDTMDEKGKLIDELDKLDEGFTSTYELVKDDVMGNPSQYRDKVLKMQELIKQAVDKGVGIEAKEKRSKAAMESEITSRRKDIRTKRLSMSAASKYYKAASRINTIDPQLLDRKK